MTERALRSTLSNARDGAESQLPQGNFSNRNGSRTCLVNTFGLAGTYLGRAAGRDLLNTVDSTTPLFLPLCYSGAWRWVVTERSVRLSMASIRYLGHPPRRRAPRPLHSLKVYLRPTLFRLIMQVRRPPKFTFQRGVKIYL